VINEVKRLRYNDKITNCNNTSKATWNIIRVELGKNHLKDNNSKTEKINPSIFNNYFLNIISNITPKIFTQTTFNIDSNRNFTHYLNLTTKGPFPKIILKNITPKEIEKVISSLYSKILLDRMRFQ
jgi:hypothetical protein